MSDGTLADVDDVGYFGPRSVSWRVHREVTVLFGGARALLHAGGAPARGRRSEPDRHVRPEPVAAAAANAGPDVHDHVRHEGRGPRGGRKINEVHARINGVDPVTGRAYDALDPELLLYVHACLVDSALLFEELTVGTLDDRWPPAVPRGADAGGGAGQGPAGDDPADGTRAACVATPRGRRELLVTEGARRVADLFLHPPEEAEWRAVLHGVSRLAFATLPAPVRERYGIPMTQAKAAALRATFASIRGVRPLPARPVPIPRALQRVAAPATRPGGGCRRRRASAFARDQARRLDSAGGRRGWTAARHRRRARGVVGADARIGRCDGADPRGADPVPAHHEHDHPDAPDLAATLGRAGFDVTPEEIVTAVTQRRRTCGRHIPGRRSSSCPTATRARIWGRRARRRPETPTWSCSAAPATTSRTRDEQRSSVG